MKVGKNIYTILKKNNLIVYLMSFITISTITLCCFLVYILYKDSRSTIYTIDSKGQMLPLTLLEDKKDNMRKVMSNIDYFVSNAYDIDAFNYKDKRQKLAWLVNNNVHKIWKDKENKGYYNQLVQYNIIQHAIVNPKSFKFLTSEEPYKANFTVLLNIINNEKQEFYNIDITATLRECSINYPYNPFGLIITDFIESRKILIQDKEELDNLNNDKKTE